MHDTIGAKITHYCPILEEIPFGKGNSKGKIPKGNPPFFECLIMVIKYVQLIFRISTDYYLNCLRKKWKFSASLSKIIHSSIMYENEGTCKYFCKISKYAICELKYKTF